MERSSDATARPAGDALSAPSAGPSCESCGGPVELTLKGEPRKFCDKRPCQYDAHAKAGRTGQRGRRHFERKSKRCPSCGKTKPLTAEHWSPLRRDPDTGMVLAYQGYCRPCASADASARYATNARRQRAARARAARQREEIRERRASDPEFDRLYRERARQWARGERRRQPRSRPSRDEAGGRMPKLPALPLGRAVRAVAERETPSNPLAIRGPDDTYGSRFDGVCARADVDPRQAFAWETGEYEGVHFDVADRVMAQLGLLWWDVWPADEYPEVAKLWEPEEVAA